MSAVDVLACLPATTLTRTGLQLRMAGSRSGSTVHLLDDDERAARARCGRRAPVSFDVEAAPARRVCTSCARRLPELTRMHLVTLGRPTVAELAAVREAEALQIATDCRDRLEALRAEAVLEGSVSERVVFDGDPPAASDYNGHRGDDVALTVGLMIGALIPGAMTGGRVWLPGSPTGPARTTSPGGAAAAGLPFTPHAAGRFPTPGGRRFGAVR